jgi:hypothetical protein
MNETRNLTEVVTITKETYDELVRAKNNIDVVIKMLSITDSSAYLRGETIVALLTYKPDKEISIPDFMTKG